jgi:hypothetical protein
MLLIFAVRPGIATQAIEVWARSILRVAAHV